MRRVAAKFVPRQLTDAQKVNRVTVSQKLFDLSNADENFPKNITGDETWMYGYNVESAVVTLNGKIVTTTKESTPESLKCESEADSSFIGRLSFIMSLFHVVRQSIKSST